MAMAAEKNNEPTLESSSNKSNSSRGTSDSPHQQQNSTKQNLEHHPLVIVGGGIGGLVLALCLDQIYNHPATNGTTTAPTTDRANATNHLSIHIYESCGDYRANAGGAIGLYPNGLRVLRHLSQTHPALSGLLRQVREAGCDYRYRRWMRHDGLEVAVAREDELLPDLFDDLDDAAIENERGGGKETSGCSDKSSILTTAAWGDSIAGVEGEPANHRPRGGSFATIRKSFSNLTLMRSNDNNGSNVSKRSSGASTATTGNSSSTSSRSSMVETELLSLGIRRWKYQQVLYEACIAAGIHIHFGKRLQAVTSIPPSSNCDDDGDGDYTDGNLNNSKTLLQFKDGAKVITSLVIGADGINSKVRNYVTNPQQSTTMSAAAANSSNKQQQQEYVPEYTGVTCLMGIASVPRIRGICFPSSATTKCHACYYPTHIPSSAVVQNNNTINYESPEEEYEQVFQIYFPSPIERPDTWRTLTAVEAKEECQELANKLRGDGWDEQFLKPLESESLNGVLRVGLRSREGLDCWHVGTNSNDDTNGNDGSNSSDQPAMRGRAVLLGDAAHPPVPYIGQGAMMAMEDAGTLSMLLGYYCPLISQQTTRKGNDIDASPATSTMPPQIDLAQFTKAMATYEHLRITRTRAILGSSIALGKTQQKRAESKLYNAYRELTIKAQVWAYGTLPVMRPGAAFDYRLVVEEALKLERNK